MNKPSLNSKISLKYFYYAVGFTLLEILIVMVIIAIASSIIIIKSGNFYLSNKRSEIIAQEMASLIRMAKNQAILSMNTIGLRLSTTEYEFLILDDTNGISWKNMGQHDSFWRKRSIPEGVAVDYKSDNTYQNTGPQSSSQPPQILILSSGDMTPFIISIHNIGSSKVYTIKGNHSGQISLEQQ